ncbi:hypothetical protein PAPYR_9202 [Paratrimastix pyriformis]|uniref:NTF2-related export protein n=1 Tax=Paratrimastix pyriformis TaxID=342808 RepID=A0ABQ8UG37_9EUKA|nr:hypothetical protein PAPYR_9202 [Paratrimastix pyriformis]
MATSHLDIGKQLVQYYYSIYDQPAPVPAPGQPTPPHPRGAGLAGLYKPDALLDYEGTRCVGAAQIRAKLDEAPTVQRDTPNLSFDAQPTPSGLLVTVLGRLALEGQTNPITFSEVFHFVQAGPSWAISNQIFKCVFC